MKEVAEVGLVTVMFTASQERLLRHLGTFPESLESAWDVPREVSLPGLAEAMSVVRSGLNHPLGVLEKHGFIQMRLAHVIGGGSRRRQVYHITEAGRGWLHEHPIESKPATSESIPEESSSLDIVGRDEDVLAIENLLVSSECVVLEGLSGIGKTTVSKALSGRLMQRDWAIHVASLNELSDARSIVEQWYPSASSVPHDLDALCALLQPSNTQHLFVLDDLHLLPPRHQASCLALVDHLRPLQWANVLLVGRNPLPFSVEASVHRLGPLDFSDAAQLLGDETEASQRRSIAKALGGHPMALLLHQEGDPLPEAGKDVQNYVKETILGLLKEELHDSLDQLVLLPHPINGAVAPQQDTIAPLDERALLRWTGGGVKLEVQHLIRNVRRTMLAPHELEKLHRAALEHWNGSEPTSTAQVLSLYHQLALDEEASRPEIERAIEQLTPSHDGAVAVILDRAVKAKPEDETLHFWAANVALERQEYDQVTHHLESISSKAYHQELSYRLALAQGKEAESERLLNETLETVEHDEGARLLLRAAIQRLDDNLFDDEPTDMADEITRLLRRLTLPSDPVARAPMTVSMTMIQHALALHEGDAQRAAELRDALINISHDNDPFVQQLLLKDALHSSTVSEIESLMSLVERVIEAQPSSFHRSMVQLSVTEWLVSKNDDMARQRFKLLTQPDDLVTVGLHRHRYAGRWWYLRSKLEPSQALMALRESARYFRSAGCHDAARSLVMRMHRLL
ncbi:MAG: hypothetical protein L7S56_04180 [Candidatus Poseidonia sp.]|nr:hypothetical protein [Poseidonia sp.]